MRKNQETKLDVFKEDLNQLKRSGHLNARELRHWFAWIINDATRLVTGDPGRKLKDTGTRKDSIIVINQHTYAVIECVMHYEPGAGTAPEVDKLSHVFKGIALEDVTAPENKWSYLRVKLTVDLQQWPELAVGMLWDELDEGLIKKKKEGAAQETMLDHVQKLLSLLNPNVSIEEIKISADLGLLDTKQAFLSWFATNEPHRQKVNVELPDNMNFG